MYYIKTLMKNTIFKLTKYVYYFSLLVLLILYLFPGSLIGYLLYGNLGQQPDFLANPIGTSINHLIFFSYITVLAITVRKKVKNIFTNYRVILFISCVLEIFHLIIPNRAFELYDLIANITGVVVILFINSLIKWRKYL
jgi:VanZ family protein